MGIARAYAQFSKEQAQLDATVQRQRSRKLQSSDKTYKRKGNKIVYYRLLFLVPLRLGLSSRCLRLSCRGMPISSS